MCLATAIQRTLSGGSRHPLALSEGNRRQNRSRPGKQELRRGTHDTGSWDAQREDASVCLLDYRRGRKVSSEGLLSPKTWDLTSETCFTGLRFSRRVWRP